VKATHSGEEVHEFRSKALYAPVALLTFAMASYAASPHYFITNNDSSQGNSSTFYTIINNSLLKQAAVVATRGTGVDGIGSVATKRVNIFSNSSQACAIISDAGTADVAGISINTFGFHRNV
jgi:hypothetical protein